MLLVELRTDVDHLASPAPTDTIMHTLRPLQKIEETEEEHTDGVPPVSKLPQVLTNCDMGRLDAVQREHSERLELLLRSMEGLRQQQEKFVSMSLQQAREEWSTWLDAEK